MEQQTQHIVTFEERLEIAKILESSHSIFRQFWDIGSPDLVDDKAYLNTACIVFDKEGNNIGFLWDVDYWNSLDTYTRAFVAGHEMLHVILNHGPRMLTHKDDDRSNGAMDLVVNHLLVNHFGFDRDLLCIEWEDLYWVDTAFEEDARPPDDKSYEYYYNFMKTHDPASKMTLDKHGEVKDGEKYSNDPSDIVIEVCSNLIPEDFDENMLSIMEAYGFGDKAGKGLGAWMDVVPKPKPKIIKKWERLSSPTKKKLVYDYNDFNTWIRDNKRLAEMLDEMPIMLETEVYMENYYYESRETTVWFFLDFSGSCRSYVNRFLKAVKTLDNNKFDVTMFTFDTSCREITDPSKVWGGGGTNFSSIVKMINEKVDRGSMFPDLVFVITDGFASRVTAPRPERWHWFLTERNSTNSIPKKSHIHRLSDFE